MAKKKRVRKPLDKEGVIDQAKMKMAEQTGGGVMLFHDITPNGNSFLRMEIYGDITKASQADEIILYGVKHAMTMDEAVASLDVGEGED